MKIKHCNNCEYETVHKTHKRSCGKCRSRNTKVYWVNENGSVVSELKKRNQEG